jgi:hypothetical protein
MECYSAMWFYDGTARLAARLGGTIPPAGN